MFIFKIKHLGKSVFNKNLFFTFYRVYHISYKKEEPIVFSSQSYFPKVLLFTRCANSNGFCRCFAFQIGKICCHHCIVRHFQFRKCLPVYSNVYCILYKVQLNLATASYSKPARYGKKHLTAQPFTETKKDGSLYLPENRPLFHFLSNCYFQEHSDRSFVEPEQTFLQICLPFYPQTSSAISFSFAHCSSSVSLLPISQDAKPHCGLK